MFNRILEARDRELAAAIHFARFHDPQSSSMIPDIAVVQYWKNNHCAKHRTDDEPTQKRQTHAHPPVENAESQRNDSSGFSKGDIGKDKQKAQGRLCQPCARKN
jgi:hypothetical protein